MFNKVLIANRGEIAVRIIRACRAMGIATVAIHSTADASALHAQLADEALCVGPASPLDSYLNQYAVLSAAALTGAEAIHPGYGFLAENAKFARMCEKSDIAFIGPPADPMERMGDKLYARRTMREAGVPITPGSLEALTSVDEALALANEVGYPVMVKAAAGGGGRGIRKVDGPEQMESAFSQATAEAQMAFGDGRLFLEKCVLDARHIEFQIIADAHGNVVHLGERDCSMQRRNQKLLEEAPSSALDGELRERMGRAAVAAARAVGYQNAGTVEFLVNRNHEFYFMEMNTRIQVEHPVTEMVTGVDLVQEQLRVAAGEPLSFTQKDIILRGHAIECRINAEDPAHDFRPACGTVEMLHIPQGPGVRFDSGLYVGWQVPPHYDSMLGKLIVHGRDRKDAIARMKAALMEIVVSGFPTNIDFELDLVSHPGFEAGSYDTSFIAREMK